MPFKQFVTKNYRNRSKARKKLNAITVLREFVGYKLYGLICTVPKAYISFNEADPTDLQLNVEHLPKEAQTLREFLLGKQRYLDPATCSDNKKKKIQEKLANLSGMGALCFMAMLLGDRDVFGPRLDNVLVRNNEVIKIDPSEISLDSDFEEAYSKKLPECLKAALNKDDFFSHHNQNTGGMPFFGFFLKLLSKEQIAEGVSALRALTKDELEKNLSWIADRMSKPESYVTKMLETLEKRRDLILSTYDPQQLISDRLPVRDIKQTIVIRPMSDFGSSQEVNYPGRANKKITIKNSQKLLLSARDSLNQLIDQLQLKESSLDLQTNPKQTKINGIKIALDDYEKLADLIENKIKNRQNGVNDLHAIFNEYKRITDQLEKNMREDRSEKGTARVVRRRLSDAWKTLYRVFDASAQESTIGILKTQKSKFNSQFLTFFHTSDVQKPMQKPVEPADDYDSAPKSTKAS